MLLPILTNDPDIKEGEIKVMMSRWANDLVAEPQMSVCMELSSTLEDQCYSYNLEKKKRVMTQSSGFTFHLYIFFILKNSYKFLG